ncbi:MAG: prepilin-type N-terminal cleavage/methylation domain-containing protein [bacterium]|nr:prepilin-type N-terminal cleavage/methylation domain-containing protein [bacterium]
MKSSRGLTLIEVLVALAIAGMLIGGIASLTALSVRVSASSSASMQALFLAREVVEAVRSVRDETPWADGIGALVVGGTYYPSLSQDPPAWEFLAGEEEIERFTRSFTMGGVFRDANNNIASTGTEDPNTRRLMVRVSWQERSEEREEVLVTYITNWRE